MLGVFLMLLSGAYPLEQDLEQGAAQVLIQSCGRCHVPDGEFAKATRQWEDASDLAKTIAADLIVPGDPDDSEIWLVVEEGSMPPDDSPEYPLSEQDSKLLFEWIKAGAKLPAAPAQATLKPSSFPVPPPETNKDEVDSGSAFGRLHPLVVHFPIALLGVAFLAELLTLLRLGKHQPTVRFSLWIGTLGALVASFLGWSLGDLQPRSGAAGELMERHRWYAVATLAVAALSLLAAELRARSKRKATPLVRLAPLLILLGAALVSWTGHLGGALSYGPKWLEEALPAQTHALLEWVDQVLP